MDSYDFKEHAPARKNRGVFLSISVAQLRPLVSIVVGTHAPQ